MSVHRRFGLTFANTYLVPTVLVTEGLGPHKRTVAVRRGLTRQQAYFRALAWTRRHGDPR